MIIPQKQKSSRRGSNEIIRMNLDLVTLNMICKYVISSSSYLRIANLINLRKFISLLDRSMYESDPEKLKRIRFIQKGLEARIDNNLIDINLIMIHISTGLDFDVDFIDFKDRELTADEVIYIHNLVSESIQYSFCYSDSDRLLDICTRLKSTDYNHRGDIIKELESEVDLLKNKFRMSKSDDSLTDMTFSLRDGVFDNVITETYNLISNPSRRLITGMQGFNEMIAGGFESGRVYMLLGITGVGKSITLLNLAYQIKKYNKNYKPKDPTKTPCIVMLTMENTVVETITRLFDLTVENSLGMSNYSVQEVIHKLRHDGQLVLNSDSPIDLVIKYKANKSVDTSYLYTLVDDLEDDGYEIICLIQDHVKRIRSIYGHPDLRIELGDIVNELKVFAAEKDIPVITNSHLNREAAKTVEEGQAKNVKTDVTMKLGKANAGESLLMLDNIDGAIIINIDYDENGNKYMAFKKAKMRERTDREYILQPFAAGSGIKLVEDYGITPQFKEFLHMNQSINSRITNMKTSSANILNNVNDIISANQQQANTSFGTNSMYDFDISETPTEQEESAAKIVHPNIIKPIRFVPIDTKPDLTLLTELNKKLQANGTSVEEDTE